MVGVSEPLLDESAIAAAALGGDEEALGRLLSAHQHAAYNIAYRILGSEADARDAVQEAFLLTVRAIRGGTGSPRGGDRFRSWLRRVVTNAALRQLRRRPSFRPVSVDDMAEVLPAPARAEPAREVERREVRGDILLALVALPDAQRAALTLRECEGFSYDEIAAALGVSRSAVETLLFRARREFRAAYEGLATTPQPIGCPQFAPLLSAMIDDELSTATSLKAHLRECPRCRR